MLTTTLLQSHPGEDEEGDTDDTSFQFDLSADASGYGQSQDLPSPSFYTQEQAPQDLPQQPPHEPYQQPPQEPYQQPYQQPPQEPYQQPPGMEFYTQESFIFGPGAVAGPSETQERLFGEIPDTPLPERPQRERRPRVRYTPSSYQ